MNLQQSQSYFLTKSYFGAGDTPLVKSRFSASDPCPVMCSFCDLTELNCNYSTSRAKNKKNKIEKTQAHRRRR